MCIILFISFAAIIPAYNAHIAVFDEWWQHRAEAAMNNTLETYNPFPETVTNHTNKEVHKYHFYIYFFYLTNQN